MMTIAVGKMKACAVLLLVGCGYSAVSVAESPAGATPFKRNTFELRGHIGGIETEDDQVLRDLDDTDTAHAALGYWYNFNRNFSLGVSYLDGESDDYEFSFFGFLNDSVLEYNAVLVNVEGRLPLGRENYLFARLGASFYDYDVIDDDNNEKLRSDDGTDVHVAAGWRKQWGSGVGLEVLYELLPLGDEVDLKSIGVGITYSF